VRCKVAVFDSSTAVRVGKLDMFHASIHLTDERNLSVWCKKEIRRVGLLSRIVLTISLLL
jgi:hypothetical protein